MTSFRPAVRAIILNKNNELLIVNMGKCWALPGGGIDFGESLDKALKRETFEEMGIEGIFDKVIYFQDFIDKRKKDSESKHFLEYFCTIKNSESFENVENTYKTAEFSHELKDLKFVKIDEIPENFMPKAFPEFLKKYISDGNTCLDNINSEYISGI